MIRNLSRIGAVFCFILLGFLASVSAKDLGKLDCTEKEGLKPDSKLINLIISKCQPKPGQDEKTMGACLIKCLMKQQKALDKKGKLKIKKASEVVDIFPDKYRDQLISRFESCATEHNPKLKKEANGCESWFPFTECFYSFTKDLCPSEQRKKEMEMEGNSTTASNEQTTAAP